MSGAIGPSPAQRMRALHLLTLMVAVTGRAVVAAQSEPLPEEQPKPASQAEEAKPADHSNAASQAEEAKPVEAPKAAISAEQAKPALKPVQPKAAMSAELAKPAPKAAMSAELAKPVLKAEQPKLDAEATQAEPLTLQAQPLDAPSPVAPVAPVAPLQEQQQAEGPRTLRNLVVPQFAAPPRSRARAAVLQTLADHAEVEVVAIDDVTFASHRLQAVPNSPEGRAKLSRELGHRRVVGWASHRNQRAPDPDSRRWHVAAGSRR